MGNPLLNVMGGMPSAPNQQLLQQIRSNPGAFVPQIKADPVGFMRQFGYNIPDGMTNPQQIAQHIFGGRFG